LYEYKTKKREGIPEVEEKKKGRTKQPGKLKAASRDLPEVQFLTV
jgi:hypothetical protein